jgi:hypothetical protein
MDTGIMNFYLKHNRVGDGAEGPYGGGPVAVLLPRHILGEGGGDDDHILSYAGQLLDAQVHQPTQHSVLRLADIFILYIYLYFILYIYLYFILYIYIYILYIFIIFISVLRIRTIFDRIRIRVRLSKTSGS